MGDFPGIDGLGRTLFPRISDLKRYFSDVDAFFSDVSSIFSDVIARKYD
jgi:hypothetical protein